MVGDLVRRHTLLAPRRRCRCWRQRRPGSPHPTVHDRSGFPRAPRTSPPNPRARSSAATAVRRPAAASATPLEGTQRRMRPTRASALARQNSARTASTNRDPLGAHSGSGRSRSSPLCKRPDPWPSLVSSRARASPRRAGAWTQPIDAPAMHESRRPVSTPRRKEWGWRREGEGRMWSGAHPPGPPGDPLSQMARGANGTSQGPPGGSAGAKRQAPAAPVPPCG